MVGCGGKSYTFYMMISSAVVCFFGLTQTVFMIVMQLNIEVCFQMSVASNCSNFTSFDLRTKPRTALNESNEYSSNRGQAVGIIPNLLQT